MTTAVYSKSENNADTNEGEMKSLGLVDAHAYSLIGAREVRNWTGKTYRLL